MQSNQYKKIQDLLKQKKELLKQYQKDNRSNELINSLIDKITVIREVLELIRE